MKKILVTGGAGYIGSITVKTLLDSDFDVVVFDNLSTGHREAVDKRVELIIGDLSNISDIEKVFQENKFDAVIDFAASIAVGESMENPKKYLDNNVGNFINLLDSMTKYDCLNLIKSSTAAVYGEPKNATDLPLKEEYTDNYKPKQSELLSGIWDNQVLVGEEFFKKIIGYYSKIIIGRPELELKDDEITKLRILSSVYGLTKMLDEIIMKKYEKSVNLNYVILRYFNVAGADASGTRGLDAKSPTHLLIRIIFQLLGKIDELKIFGNDFSTPDGTGVRDYIYVGDLADGHVKALNFLLKEHKPDIFNLGTGTGYSVLQMIKTAQNVTGKRVKYSFEKRRTGDPANLYANPKKANDILGWRAQHNLEYMVKTSWRWHSTHPNGYKN